MTTALTAFYGQLLPELPGCPQPMVDIHLRETARQFCQRTKAWRAPFDAIDLVAAQDTYDLSSPESNSDVVCITKLTVAGVLLWEDTDAESLNESAVPPKYGRDSPPFSIGMNIDAITLIADEVPTASLTAGLVMSGALKPSPKAATLPDFLMNQYSEAMRTGTLARLKAMTNQKWTDLVLAPVYATQFSAFMDFAAYQAKTGNTRQTLRVRKWG